MNIRLCFFCDNSVPAPGDVCQSTSCQDELRRFRAALAERLKPLLKASFPVPETPRIKA
jgi:hypothetical protein